MIIITTMPPAEAMIMLDFIWYAALAGIGITLMTGPLGCFIVWRRLSYFGDTLSHGALLGVGLSLFSGLPSQLAVFGVSVLIALLLSQLERSRRLSSDALLGLLSHSALALGVVTIALLGPSNIDLESLLFGDLLLVTQTDLIVIASMVLLVWALLKWCWNAMVAATLSPELAAAEGQSPRVAQLALTLMIAGVIAVSIKLVGALLITAMLILPAAVARGLAKTPEQMAVMASLVGALSVILGITGAWHFDTPTGPSIVLAALTMFIITQVMTARRT
jgi:zinc transport system permease protein